MKTTEMKNCRGWGEDCGNQVPSTVDLCPDCTMGRMTEESPLIPQ